MTFWEWWSDWGYLVSMAVFVGGWVLILQDWGRRSAEDALKEQERQDSLDTPEKQREEGDRLIERAIRSYSVEYGAYLREIAQAHYTKADRMEAKAKAKAKQ